MSAKAGIIDESWAKYFDYNIQFPHEEHFKVDDKPYPFPLDLLENPDGHVVIIPFVLKLDVSEHWVFCYSDVMSEIEIEGYRKAFEIPTNMKVTDVIVKQDFNFATKVNLLVSRENLSMVSLVFKALKRMKSFQAAREQKALFDFTYRMTPGIYALKSERMTASNRVRLLRADAHQYGELEQVFTELVRRNHHFRPALMFGENGLIEQTKASLLRHNNPFHG